jgi:hypothetical protein
MCHPAPEPGHTNANSIFDRNPGGVSTHRSWWVRCHHRSILATKTDLLKYRGDHSSFAGPKEKLWPAKFCLLSFNYELLYLTEDLDNFYGF